MKKTQYIINGTIALCVVLFLGLSCENNSDVKQASFSSRRDVQVAYGSSCPVSFTIPDNVDKVELIYNDSTVTSLKGKKGKQKFTLAASHYGVGSRYLVLRSYLNDGSQLEETIIIRVVSDLVPEPLKTEIVKAYPHNRENYTQGLEFSNGELFEGTGDPGQQGKTTLGKVNLETGDFIMQKGLDATHFGEGITIMGDKIYQITWQSGKCFVYDKKDLNMQLKDFTYTGEGWGLCNNGKQLIMSDGSEHIYFRNPKTFLIERTIDVYDNEGALINLNELEYVDGKIYANIYTTNLIVAIDPATGRVLQQIDATELMVQGKNGGDVLNGIAYNQLTKQWYMTGKYWNKLFEVKLVP